MDRLLIALALLSASLVGVTAVHWSIRRRINATVKGRVELTEAEFSALFPGAEQSAVAVRRALTSVFSGNIALIRPDDQVVKELMVAAIDGLDANELIEELQRSCAISIPDARSIEVRTVGDLVRLVQDCKDERSDHWSNRST